MPKRTLKVLKKLVEAEHRITAKELKEKNSQLLQQVSVWEIHHLKNDLSFDHRAPQHKPILTEKQKQKCPILKEISKVGQ
ncbi:hypothetical protein E2C01_035360 [Portunus trituberculatus]|uniref:Uncharacterized protein n=1 Tax=Portunus trituberculatus TaxID=210409 RepID=A0A5B7F893_PORTR|nr:hypothetical protein [Portunus trituberculatus]